MLAGIIATVKTFHFIAEIIAKLKSFIEKKFISSNSCNK